jgi:hypothetical protein
MKKIVNVQQCFLFNLRSDQKVLSDWTSPETVELLSKLVYGSDLPPNVCLEIKISILVRYMIFTFVCILPFIKISKLLDLIKKVHSGLRHIYYKFRNGDMYVKERTTQLRSRI